MLVCDRVEANAFRVLRLSGRSKWEEIQAAATALKRAVTLGYAGITEADLPGIHAAVDALSNPRQRIQHRLFWFHDPACMEHAMGAQTPSALAGVEAAHDNALRSLIAAYFEEESKTGGMASALLQWHELLRQPAYWDALNRIELDGVFEAAASAEEISDLRDNAMTLAAEPFDEATGNSWVRKEFPAVRAYLSGLKQLEQTGRWASECKQSLICRITGQLGDACGIFANKYRAQIIYRDGMEQHNERVCIEELRYFREFIEPAWNGVRSALPEDATEVPLARGQAADCLASIAIDHTWAGGRVLAEELAAEAVILAAGAAAEPRIRLALSTLLEADDTSEYETAEMQETETADEIQDEVAELQQSDEIDRLSRPSRSADSAVELVRQRCANLASTFASAIVAKKERIAQNRLVCGEELAYFRTQIEPALHQAVQLLQPSAPVVTDLREQVAVCLANIATHHIWADDSVTAEQLIAESLQLAQGTWAAQALENKFLQIRESSGKMPSRRQDLWRVGTCAGAAAIVFLALTAYHRDSPSIAAAPRPISDRLPNPPNPQLDETALRLKVLEARIQVGKDHAANIDRRIRTLHDEIELLREDRVAGEQVDSEVLNAKLYSYNTLLGARSRASSQVNADVRMRDQLVAEGTLLLNALTPKTDLHQND